MSGGSRRAVLIAAGLVVAVPADAVVLGGGVADKDCRVVFEGVNATAGASGVVCVDGDPTCDGDGVADGTCSFDVRVCVGVAIAACEPVALDRIEVNGAIIIPPSVPAPDGSCGPVAALPVAVDTASATTLRAVLGNELREVDYLNLCCVAAAGPFDAAACAVAFDPAASGCASVPERVVRKLTRAKEKAAEAEADPTNGQKPLRKAARLMGRVRATGQKIARHDTCGFALGLMASHAQETLQTAVETTEPASGEEMR